MGEQLAKIEQKKIVYAEQRRMTYFRDEILFF